MNSKFFVCFKDSIVNMFLIDFCDYKKLEIIFLELTLIIGALIKFRKSQSQVKIRPILLLPGVNFKKVLQNPKEAADDFSGRCSLWTIRYLCSSIRTFR